MRLKSLNNTTHSPFSQLSADLRLCLISTTENSINNSVQTKKANSNINNWGKKHMQRAIWDMRPTWVMEMLSVCHLSCCTEVWPVPVLSSLCGSVLILTSLWLLQPVELWLENKTKLKQMKQNCWQTQGKTDRPHRKQPNCFMRLKK